MGAVILNGAEIGAGCLIAAEGLIPEGKPSRKTVYRQSGIWEQRENQGSKILQKDIKNWTDFFAE